MSLFTFLFKKPKSDASVAVPAPIPVPVLNPGNPYNSFLNPTSDAGANTLLATATLAEGFEGFSPTPYQDWGGVWTIGYGSTRDISGLPVTEHTGRITVAMAHSLMSRDLRSSLQGVKDLVKTPLSDNETEALTDFIYNVGRGNFATSTLLRLINAGDMAGAAAEFDKWNHASGKVLAGLTRRRAEEKVLFEKKP